MLVLLHASLPSITTVHAQAALGPNGFESSVKTITGRSQLILLSFGC